MAELATYRQRANDPDPSKDRLLTMRKNAMDRGNEAFVEHFEQALNDRFPGAINSLTFSPLDWA